MRKPNLHAPAEKHLLKHLVSVVHPVNIYQKFRHRTIKFRRNFPFHLTGRIKRPCKRPVLNHGYTVFFRCPDDSEGKIILSLCQHHRSRAFFRIIFQGNRKMRRVPYNHIRLRNTLHHPAHSHLSLDSADSAFDLRISFCHLIFVLDFLLGHLQIALIVPSLVEKIKKSHHRKGKTDFYDQVVHHLQHKSRGTVCLHVKHEGYFT